MQKIKSQIKREEEVPECDQTWRNQWRFQMDGQTMYASIIIEEDAMGAVIDRIYAKNAREDIRMWIVRQQSEKTKLL